MILDLITINLHQNKTLKKCLAARHISLLIEKIEKKWGLDRCKKTKKRGCLTRKERIKCDVWLKK